MEISRERREQLLAGVSPSVSASSKTANWCPDVRQAPAWVQERVLEIRVALADGCPIPPPTRSWIQGAEQRMLQQAQRAAHFVNQAVVSLAGKLTWSQALAISKSTGRCVEEVVGGYSPKISEDRFLRMKLEAIGEIIQRSKKETEDDSRRFGFGLG